MRKYDKGGKFTHAFLNALKKTGNVSLSAKEAGINRQTAYEWREKDATFAALWQEALDEAIDTLEEEAWRRGRDGTPEYVTCGKGLVLDKNGEPLMQNRYSDTLLVRLLTAHRPERFKDRSSVDMNVTGNLAEMLDEGRKRVQNRNNNDS